MALNIKIRRARLRGEDGNIVRHGSGNYTITLHSDLDGLPLAVAAFHELLHFLSYEYLQFKNIEKEHRWIKAHEASFRRHWKRWWRDG